jgi:hypothetical protein
MPKRNETAYSMTHDPLNEEDNPEVANSQLYNFIKFQYETEKDKRESMLNFFIFRIKITV